MDLDYVRCYIPPEAIKPAMRRAARREERQARKAAKRAQGTGWLARLLHPNPAGMGRRAIDSGLPYGHWAKGWERPALPGKTTVAMPSKPVSGLVFLARQEKKR